MLPGTSFDIPFGYGHPRHVILQSPAPLNFWPLSLHSPVLTSGQVFWFCTSTPPLKFSVKGIHLHLSMIHLSKKKSRLMAHYGTNYNSFCTFAGTTSTSGHVYPQLQLPVSSSSSSFMFSELTFASDGLPLKHPRGCTSVASVWLQGGVVAGAPCDRQHGTPKACCQVCIAATIMRKHIGVGIGRTDAPRGLILQGQNPTSPPKIHLRAGQDQTIQCCIFRQYTIAIVDTLSLR